MGLFDIVQEMGHEQVVFSHDPVSGLKSIIAIHDTTLGPALGGCRLWDYASEEDAVVDVLNLSKGMTYKAAVAGLNLGGGKAVIIGKPEIKSEALFRAFGRFVNTLSGRYITAEDVNCNVKDMDYVSMETDYVTGIDALGGSGDPSPITALGVFHGLRAAVKHKLGRDDLQGLTVAVQGVGAVGSFLCQYLTEAGAKLVVADINDAKVKAIADKYGARVSSIDSIHAEDVDVYSPNALGGALNDQTVPEIKATVVAGGANNQLKDEGRHGRMLLERGILYAPDYVINAGGLINVYHELRGYNREAAKRQATDIYDTILEAFAEADKASIPTQEASNRVAERRISRMKAMANLKNNYDNQPWVNRA